MNRETCAYCQVPVDETLEMGHVQWFLVKPCEESAGLKGTDWVIHVHQCERHDHLHFCDECYDKEEVVRGLVATRGGWFPGEVPA